MTTSQQVTLTVQSIVLLGVCVLLWWLFQALRGMRDAIKELLLSVARIIGDTLSDSPRVKGVPWGIGPRSDGLWRATCFPCRHQSPPVTEQQAREWLTQHLATKSHDEITDKLVADHEG